MRCFRRFRLLSGLVATAVLMCNPFGGLVFASASHEVGITVGTTLLRMDKSGLNKRLDDIKSLGVSWVRIDFSWPFIQPDDPERYDWGLYDQVVNTVTDHGLKILAMLEDTPKWAREPKCATLVKDETTAQKCSPRSANEFGHFAGMIAQRYKEKNIYAWEIWNEPNLNAYWKTAQSSDTIVSPESYADVANAAASRIKAHAPATAVITGGLAPMFEPVYPFSMRQSDYLARLLPKLDIKLFDGIGIHPYSWPVLPGKKAVYNAFYTVDNGKPAYNLRTIMQRYGWGDKKIWGTEFGASTKGVKGIANRKPTAGNRPDHVTENAQAQIIKQGVDNWYAKSNIGPLFIHSDSDQWLAARNNEGGYGLRRADSSEKPAYSALKQAIQTE